MFDGKTIILGAPKHYNLDKVIETELRDLGFNTINISFYSNQFSYKHLLQRIECFICRCFLGIKDYRNRIKFNASQQWMETKLAEAPLADYALIIRPDVYSVDFINALRSKTKKLIAYQWDGLDRYPNVYKYIGLFDRFFVFDGDDLGVQSVMPITNYYPVACSDQLHYDESLQSDVFYTGTYSRQRIALLDRLVRDFQSLGQDVKCHLYYKKKRYLPLSNLSTVNKPLDYEQNLKYTYNAKIILDLVTPEHDGLSFRFFEAIRFEKKIITTNHRVVEYDFYHPDNIFVWDNSDIKDLEAFIHRPYVPLSSDVKEKYSFRNWLQYALDEGKYERLSIPY